MDAGPPDLPAGHDVRACVVRALLLMGATVVVFTAFAALTTQLPAVRAGSPWQNDPYDVVVSFTELFVPALGVLALARALLGRRREPLPVARADQLLRAAKACGFLVGATVMTDVVALTLRADHRLWDRLTPIAIAALALLAAVLCVSAAAVWQTHGDVRRLVGHAAPAGDWLGDLPLLATRVTASWPARYRRGAGALADRIARWPALPGPLSTAAFGATLLLAGAALAGEQALREGQPFLLFVFGTLLFAGTTYGFLATANSYLHLAAVPRPATRAAQALRASFTLGCLTLPGAVAFRGIIVDTIGVAHQAQTPGELCLLTFGTGAAVTCSAFLVLLATPAGHPRGRRTGGAPSAPNRSRQ